ncbi:MAG: hypothetical protein HZY76_12175 [Anaerolineae bacterium]|nr:MAG: hypothetical protein HZY76_12175 [Anaerolineae bacterium]
MLDLVTVSRETLTQIAAEKEAQRQRELGQAQKLAEEQRLRAEEGEKSARVAQAADPGCNHRGSRAHARSDRPVVRSAVAKQREKAQLEAQRARSNELAANAQVELAQTPPDHSLALLLATESSKIRQADSESAVFPASFRALVESVVAAPDYRLSLPPHLHSGAINSIAFSPQCLRPAPSEGRPCPRALLTTGDETARLWDSETMQQLGQPLGHSSEVFYAQFSFDGSRILTQDMDGTLYVWKVSEDGRLLQKINPAKLSLAVGLTPDGQEVMAVLQRA